MVESLVATLLLAPLLFAIVGLSSLQSAEQATLGAARVAALAAHHGLDAETEPLSPRQVTQLFLGADRWNGSLSVEGTPQPGAAEQAESVALALIIPARIVGVGSLDFGPAEAVSARAEATPPRVFGEWIADGPAPRVSSSLALMRDDWDAPSAARVWQRAAALSTTGRIAAWRGALSAMAAPMELLEPAVRRLCLGRIDPDIVPEDRLRGIARAPDLRTRPC
jgi:hypothetical protein